MINLRRLTVASALALGFAVPAYSQSVTTYAYSRCNVKMGSTYVAAIVVRWPNGGMEIFVSGQGGMTRAIAFDAERAAQFIRDRYSLPASSILKGYGTFFCNRIVESDDMMPLAPPPPPPPPMPPQDPEDPQDDPQEQPQ